MFQVSHHPPVSALHATHENENIDVTWCQYFTPKFRGMIFSFISSISKQPLFFIFFNNQLFYYLNECDMDNQTEIKQQRDEYPKTF